MTGSATRLVLWWLVCSVIGCAPGDEPPSTLSPPPRLEADASSPPTQPTHAQRGSTPGRDSQSALREAALLIGMYRDGDPQVLRMHDGAMISQFRRSSGLSTPWITQPHELSPAIDIIRLVNGSLGVMLSCRRANRFEKHKCWRIEEYDGTPIGLQIYYLDAPHEIAQELADALRDLVMSLQQPSTTQ